MKFNSVGFVGILIQISTLMLLVKFSGFHYLVATIFAVEAAIINNFIWHERWTWADRRIHSFHAVITRLLYFHLTNGLISIFGNMILMTLFVERFSINYLPANGLAIATCSIFNFIAGDRIVFRTAGIKPPKGEWNMHAPKNSKSPQTLLFIVLLFLLRPSTVESAELQTETIEAWNRYVQITEQRIQHELDSDNRFFIMDFHKKDEALLEYKNIASGEILIRKMDDQAKLNFKVPGGKIHHWRGAVLIPDTNLEHVISRIDSPGSSDMGQEDVLESRILERFDDGFRLFLKLQRSKIVTVVYNTEHRVRLERIGTARASSSSVATKIAEVEILENNQEREKPEGKDHGFLWRMNSYWRYKQVPEGVIVECESLTLSRGIPRMLDIMIRSIVDGIARESMERTLLSMRNRMIRDDRIAGNIHSDLDFNEAGNP